MTHTGHGLTRRAALRLLVWLGAGAWASSACAPDREAERVQLSPKLLPHGDSARVMGGQFLRDHPEEADTGRLLALLELPASTVDRGADVIMDHRERLSAASREDFRAGRVFDVGGWRLSHTEARLAALASLAAP